MTVLDWLCSFPYFKGRPRFIAERFLFFPSSNIFNNAPLQHRLIRYTIVKPQQFHRGRYKDINKETSVAEWKKKARLVLSIINLFEGISRLHYQAQYHRTSLGLDQLTSQSNKYTEYIFMKISDSFSQMLAILTLENAALN